MTRAEAVLARSALAVTLAVAVAVPRAVVANEQIVQTPLPGSSIPKYVDAMPTFTNGARVEARPPGHPFYTVGMEEFQQQVLPAGLYPSDHAAGTWVWGYRVDGRPAHYPGFTVEAQRGFPVVATYLNHLGQRLEDGTFAPPILQKYLTVDQTLHWADPLRLLCPFLPPAEAAAAGCYTPYGYPTWPGFPLPDPRTTGGPVPAAVHLHGGENPSFADGGPQQWFTPDGWRFRDPTTGALGPPHPAITGPAYFSLVPIPGGASYLYPNRQEATTLWFHDHALGTTRINVWAGMAAFYLLRDRFDTGRTNNAIGLPADPFEIEVAVQDRLFDTDGQFIYPDVGVNPSLCGSGPSTPAASPLCHPFWVPEAFGDTIVVNGKTWPFVEVEPRRYRFRLLDGSNARFYRMAFVGDSGPGPDIWIIGTDGGLLDAPARVPAASERLLIAPGERYDVIVDFTRFAGQTLTLVNDAPAPFPTGDAPDPATTGQLLQFRVTKAPSSRDRTCDPATAPPWSIGGFGGRDDGEDDAQARGGDRDGGRAVPCRLRGGRAREPEIVRLTDPEGGVLAPGVHPTLRRQLVLREVTGPDDAPVEVLLNNTRFSGVRESTLTTDPERIPDSVPAPYTTGDPGDANRDWATELPRVGSTELWEVVNLTADAHPIHLHLVQFQLVNRQAFSPDYVTTWETSFPGGVFLPGEGPPYRYLNEDNPTVPPGSDIVGGNPLVDPFLTTPAAPPQTYEAGWKDTVIMPPGMVTRIAVRVAPQDAKVREARAGKNLYPFDPTRGPGYVWHCHILEHEDNDMMRPLLVVR